MSDIKQEQEYLDHVIELIDKKITELGDKVDVTDKDMADFHDYFWNSYTEFDEYGYELYDNTNAIRQKIQQKGDYIREQYVYRRMKDSPYFGRVDFLFEGDDEVTPCYVGISNLSEEAGSLPVVYDWRAPVSSLFYDYDSGPACYEAPAGTVYGQITDKYQYKISRGQIIYMLQSEMNIDDEILRKELGTHASASLKAIVSTIQKEQNVIIRDTVHRILAVQGCAGSGKTSVALHRIAYLLYHNRNTLKASQILILSPNGVFSDYISRILPELGEENICEMSLDIWAYKKLVKYGETQDRYDRIEEILDPANHRNHATDEHEYKQSIDYVQELDGYVLELESEGVDIRDFRHRGRTYKADYIAGLFYEKLWNKPLMERMEGVAHFIIDEEETLRGHDMSAEERQYIIDSLNEMYIDRDLIGLYNAFLDGSGRKTLPASITGINPEQDEEDDSDELYDEEGRIRNTFKKKDKGYLRANLIPYEDVYPLLYLKYSLFNGEEERPVKHLIIDEMQDYTYLQYRLIEKVFPCAMTILGDKAQTMEDKPRDILEFLPSIFGKELYKVELNRSYRSTKEITEYAASIVGLDTISSIDRHGEAVKELSYVNDDERIESLVSILKECELRADTVAVLCSNADRAKQIYTLLNEEQWENELSLITADTTTFKTGISVAPFYLTKGLEFDGVCIMDDEMPSEALHNQAMYVEATRALHELYVLRCE